MEKLICIERDTASKVKKLRKEGYVPINVYGKNLKANMNLLTTTKELAAQKHALALGGQITISKGTDLLSAIVKTIDYTPMSTKISHIDLQLLTAGEKLKTTISINYINKENLSPLGNLQVFVNSIEYEVLPKDIIDNLDVDVSTLKIGENIKISDLPISKDDRYHILSDESTKLVGYVYPQKTTTVEVTEEES